MSGVTIQIDTINIDSVTMTGDVAPQLRWHVGPMVPQGEAMALEVSMSTEQKCRLSVTPLTAGGDPAPIEGAAQWSVEGTCTLEPIDDTSTWVVAGAMGDSVVTVSADADVGEGVKTIMDTATIHVAMPMAENLGLAADAPVLQP